MDNLGRHLLVQTIFFTHAWPTALKKFPDAKKSPIACGESRPSPNPFSVRVCDCFALPKIFIKRFIFLLTTNRIRLN